MRSFDRKHLLVGLALALLAIAALRDLTRLGNAFPWRTMDDFADFYCAGAALDARASPYTYEPLHSCEHRVNTGVTFRGVLFRNNPAIAVPAPQPPYDFLPFMALARRDFPAARVIAAIAIVSSVVLCAMALARLGVPLDLALASLALSAGYVELNTGQIVPFALLALVLCGLALARKREILAGVFAALTFIEPSVAVPVVAATLLFVPRARWAVIVTGSLLAIAALALVGWGTLVTYATGVIPAQAAAEVYFPFEYSLTYALAALGLGQSAAGFAGELSYLILLAVGLFLAPRASAAFERRELVVFLPALSSVIAGSYLHQEELCFALPALLVMAVYARPTVRVVLALALCALAVPWILVWGAKQLLLASLFVCAVILLRLRIDLRVALASLGVITALIYGFELHPPHLPVPMAAQRHYASNELVQVEWREYAQERSTHDLLWFAIKLPTWAGLLAGLGVAFAVRKG